MACFLNTETWNGTSVSTFSVVQPSSAVSLKKARSEVVMPMVINWYAAQLFHLPSRHYPMWNKEWSLEWRLHLRKCSKLYQVSLCSRLFIKSFWFSALLASFTLELSVVLLLSFFLWNNCNVNCSKWYGEGASKGIYYYLWNCSRILGLLRENCRLFLALY